MKGTMKDLPVSMRVYTGRVELITVFLAEI